MKASKTERELTDALDRLVAGNSKKTDGRVTQDNIAFEAGVSRATFNRYPKVVAEYRKVRMRGGTGEVAKPFTIEDKNRELQESNIVLRKRVTHEKMGYERRLAAARQEVFILNCALRMRDETIATREREIAELNRKITELRKGLFNRFSVVDPKR